MSNNAPVIPDLGVGRHFGTTHLPCPVLGESDESATYSFQAMLGFDEPAFYVPNMIGRAILGERTDTGFKETDQSSVRRVGDQNKLRFRMSQDLKHFVSMVFAVVHIPEQLAKSKPFFQVVFTERPDSAFGFCH